MPQSLSSRGMGGKVTSGNVGSPTRPSPPRVPIPRPSPRRQQWEKLKAAAGQIRGTDYLIFAGLLVTFLLAAYVFVFDP
jgi:hypothetical protein